MARHLFFEACVLIFLAYSCSPSEEDQTGQAQDESGPTVYFNGDILTMEGDTPQYVEALVTQGGRITFAGSNDQATERAGEDATRIDLDGKTLLPGFIDAHGHAWTAGFQAVSANLLPPPDGEGSSVDAIVELLKDWADENAEAVEKYGAIIGFDGNDPFPNGAIRPIGQDEGTGYHPLFF
jgi:predicted amidohydrolase YtcJ